MNLNINLFSTCQEKNSTRKVHHKGIGVGYVLTIGRKRIYHAGDTDFIPEMKEMGSVDVAVANRKIQLDLATD